MPSTRTLTLTGTLSNLDLTPQVGAPVSAALLTLTQLAGIDLDSVTIFNGAISQVSTVTNSVGAYSLVVAYPGDISPVGCAIVVNENGVITVSPSFSYVSTVAVSSWYPVGSLAGTLKMIDTLGKLDTSALQGSPVSIVLASKATAPTGVVMPGGQGVSLNTDSGGRYAVYAYPTASCTPNNIPLIATYVDGSSDTFTVPLTPTGYQGAYAGGTTYSAHAGTKVSPADVVLDGGIYYQYINVTPAAGHTPASSPTYWQVFPGEPIAWNITLSSPPGITTYDQTTLAADAAVLTGSYTSSGGTLQDELRRLAQWPVTHVTGATYTSLDTDRIIEGDGTANAVAITLRTAVGWTGLLILKAINVAHAVTFAGTGGQTFDGATTLTPGLNVAYILYADAGNWRVAATANIGGGGGGGGSLNSVGLALPSDWFTVTVSPVTGSGGTLTAVKQNQSASTVLAGPASGAAAAPTFRALAQTDLPGITVTDSSAGTSTENALKLIPGAGIAISVADNPGAKRAEATITATGGGGSSTSVVTPPARVWRPALSPGAPVVSTPVAVTTGSNYKATPGFAVGKDGKLYAAYRIGTSHGSVDGSSTISISADGGATWPTVQTILAGTGGHAYIDVGLATTRTGRMILTTMDQGVSPNDLAYVSTDTVWASQSGTTHLQPYTSASYTSSAPFQHSSGVLIWAVYGQDSGDTSYRIGVVISSDDGGTFGSRINIGAANSGYSEASMLELPNGDILAFIRKEGSVPQAIYTSRSTNAGQTWSTPVSLGFNVYPGRPCAVAFPVTGEIVLVYRSTVNVNTVYRWSADEGATWSGEITIDGTADYVYAAGVAMGDGMIGIVYAVDAFGSAPCNIHFVTMTSGIPVISGSRAANPALATLLSGMASAGRIVDSTTAGSGPAAAFAWVQKNANYTITTSDQGVLVDCSGSAVTITLPTAIGAGQAYAVKRVDTGGGFAVTIATTGGQLIDGASALVISASPKNGAVMLGSNGIDWYVMAGYRMTPGPSFLVMEESSTFPPVPITSEDGTEWIYTDAL